MRKIETIWHYILHSALAEGRFKHTQKELAEKFGYSLSTVNLALRNPSQIGAVRKASKFFVLEDFQKLLYYWSSLRNLEKDIIYKTGVSGTVSGIEGLVPPQATFAAYSAAKKILGESPADYSRVYFYITREQLDEAKRRFPPQQNKNQEMNVFALLKSQKSFQPNTEITSIPQTFVDLWNLRDWYAKDFTKALEEKMYGILS